MAKFNPESRVHKLRILEFGGRKFVQAKYTLHQLSKCVAIVSLVLSDPKAIRIEYEKNLMNLKYLVNKS